MSKVVFKELGYYVALLIVFSILMHPDLLSSPLARFELMNKQENYLHPFIYSFFFYIVVLVLRVSVIFIRKFFRR